jgi:Fe2+ or Zn2+ uptake regulation protein
MSKGHGRVEKSILIMLASGHYFTVKTMCEWIFESQAPAAQKSIYRALASLVRQSKVTRIAASCGDYDPLGKSQARYAATEHKDAAGAKLAAAREAARARRSETLKQMEKMMRAAGFDLSGLDRP